MRRAAPRPERPAREARRADRAGLDQMTRSDAILEAIERGHAEALGADAYTALKRMYREIVERQSARREDAAGRGPGRRRA